MILKSIMFQEDDQDKNKPYCLPCCKSLCNDLMRYKKIEDHLKNVHPEHVEKALAYFQRLNERRQRNKQMSLMSLFKNKSNLNKHGLQANYELSFLLAKKSRPHTDGKELLKPAFDIYLRTMLDRGKVGHQLSSLPLSNDTVRRRIAKLPMMYSHS